MTWVLRVLLAAGWIVVPTVAGAACLAVLRLRRLAQSMRERAARRRQAREFRRTWEH